MGHSSSIVDIVCVKVCYVIQTVILEKKKLLQQWNSTLIGMRRRDEAYAAMLVAIKYVIYIYMCLIN